MNIRKDHSLGKDEARRRVENIATALSSQYKLRSNWEGDSLKIDGSGVSGHIAVGEESVDVKVRLGFALMMLESTIRSSIEDAMDKYLD